MGDALRIEIDAATGHVFMIGPAVEVLQGEIALADRERSFNKMQIRTAVPTDLQEIVKIELTPLGTNETVISAAQDQGTLSMQGLVMELSIAGTVLQIPNGTDPVLLRQTLHILKELSC